MSRFLKYGFTVLILKSHLFFLFSQNETSQWYFGYKAGLNFQSGTPPQTISNSNLSTMYGCSTISDSIGNLLFAVRAGDLIYNKQNDTMDNGQNIGGYYGGYQTSIILRKSGLQYYVITHNNLNYFSGPINLPMMNYAIVDMALASGLGSVVASCKSITPSGIPFVSKIAATKHCNGKDDWLLFHEGGWPGSTNFYSYLANSSSISTTPIITAIGNNQKQAYGTCTNCGFYPGIHKFSPNGSKVCATYECQRVELYDFNKSTGVLSNVMVIDSLPSGLCSTTWSNTISPGMAVGIEFSPDGSKLYISYLNTPQGVYQFDLSSGTATAIAASKTPVTPSLSIAYPSVVHMQLAKDGKIYIVGTSSTALSTTDNPNNPGNTCNFQLNAIPLGTITTPPYIAISGFGLPAFESTFFEKKPTLAPFTAQINCGATSFSAPILCTAAGYSINSYLWNFGDSLSGFSNTSLISNPQHTFSSNGTFTVKLILNYLPCGQDTLKQIVNVSDLPSLYVSGKTTICKGESTNLSFMGATTYTINALTTQTHVTLQPSVTTIYTLSGINNTTNCLSKIIFKVLVLPCINVFNAMHDEDLKVFPIPSNRFLNIELKDKMQISITNLPGKIVYESEFLTGNHIIDFSSLKPGIYFLIAKHKTGKLVRKFILE